jgi:hypothetical protein
LPDTTLLRLFTSRTFPYMQSVLGLLGFLLDSWTLKKGPLDYTETSVSNYHYSRQKPEITHSLPFTSYKRINT